MCRVDTVHQATSLDLMLTSKSRLGTPHWFINYLPSEGMQDLSLDGTGLGLRKIPSTGTLSLSVPLNVKAQWLECELLSSESPFAQFHRG